MKNLLSKHHIDFHVYSDNEAKYVHSVLVINAIGFLSSVYQYGSVAFIGGGFDNGIHNILEPTVFGLPVLFGPNYKKFNEAFDVIKLNAGFVIQNSGDLVQHVKKLIEDHSLLNETSMRAKNYVQQNAGATQKISQGLKLFLK